MKHDGSTGGNSTERGKIAGGLYSAWSPVLGQRERFSKQMESNSGATAEEWQRKHGEKGNFSPVEGFDSPHWVITPQKGLKPSEGE